MTRTFLGGSAIGSVKVLIMSNSYFGYWLTVQDRISWGGGWGGGGEQHCLNGRASLFSREYIPQASIARTGSEG